MNQPAPDGSSPHAGPTAFNSRETRVTVTASLRGLDHDSRWSTYDENVLKLFYVSLFSGLKKDLAPALPLPHVGQTAFNRRASQEI